MSVEDRVRAAAAARAELVTDIRPLELPATRPARPARPRLAPPPRRWATWLAPVAAAAVVIAVAAALVLARQPAASSPGGGSPAPGTGAGAFVPGRVPGAAIVPVYYAEVGSATSLVVGDDRNGAVLSTLAPPGGTTFAGVAGAGDDRTFVVDTMADGDGTHAWYLLRITPGGSDPAQLSSLPLPTLPGTDQIVGLALSPDGSELAVMFEPWKSYETQGANRVLTGPPGPFSLHTYALATGKQLRAWTAPTVTDEAISESGAGLPDNEVNLTWTADGRTLGFLYSPFTTPTDERTLSVTAPGTDLIADSRVVLAMANALPACNGEMTLTSDGKTTICSVGSYAPGGGCTAPKAEFALYPVSTGKLGGFLYRDERSCATAQDWVVWARSGDIAIGVLAIQGAGQTTNFTVGLLTPDTFTPLNVQNADLQQGEIAF